MLAVIRSTRTLIPLLALAAIALLATACDVRATTGNPQSPSGGQSEGPSQGQAPEPQTIEITLGDVFIDPSTVQAAAGAELTFEVSNTGAIQHDFVLDGVDQTSLLGAGGSATLAVGALDPGAYTFYCSVPGHREGGMEGTLTVTGDQAGHEGDHEGDSEELTWQEMDRLHLEGIQAFPADTAAQGNQILEPVMDGDVKVFELTASEFEWEVEPGVFREAMGYNGMVPGPQLRVQVGDTIRIVLHNELSESTAIHSHGMVLPFDQDGVPGLTQAPIAPGETFTYEFTVQNAGSHMYHSHYNSAKQVPMGLLGALVVEDPADEPVDQDVVMILNDGPLGYTINGKGFPATQPIVASHGQRVRVRYMNEGLQIHPMHLHGIPQRVVARDGYPLEQPYMADTVTIAPGERIDVIIEASDLGAWAFHCHILTHAEGEHGMFGMVTVMMVNE